MTESQAEVLNVIAEYGPLCDQALVPLAQHLAIVPQSSSGIRSRRAELTRQGYVTAVDTVVMPSGREAAVWDVAT